MIHRSPPPSKILEQKGNSDVMFSRVLRDWNSLLLLLSLNGMESATVNVYISPKHYNRVPHFNLIIHYIEYFPTQ